MYFRTLRDHPRHGHHHRRGRCTRRGHGEFTLMADRPVLSTSRPHNVRLAASATGN